MNNNNSELAENVQTHNIGSYTFKQTGNSSKSNSMGMREMQARAFEKRNSKYLLIQAPPACGKSRALMFLALDKVINQAIRKVIIAVPQMAIGSSFADVKLTENGFFADWKIDPQYNLCMPGGESQKVQKALMFLDDPKAQYLLCSHATLTYFYMRVENKRLFDDTLVAVDEFHHVSEDADNKLGGVIHSLMTDSSAHIFAMTGSYFRGDSIPVLSPEDERCFDRVTYTYYEQLNGYTYLKSLSIDYAFYYGSWVDAVGKILDISKKTIIHIPNVNSRESTGDKYNEVGRLFDLFGSRVGRDNETGIHIFKTGEGRFLRVADLVTNTDGMQGVTLSALRNEEVLNSIDIIIALGMAKEGFDWPQCEYALTVGYRASLTEVVQIIGRATRDYKGKSHAQFTNLLAMPDAMLTDVTDAVNSLLKAITLSLLMEQVLAPNVHFRKRGETLPDVKGEGNQNDGRNKENKNNNEQPENSKIDNNFSSLEIDIDDLSSSALDIVNNESSSIIENLINSSDTVKTALANGGEGVPKTLVYEDISEIIRENHPELTDEDIESIARYVFSTMVLKVLSHGLNSNSDLEDKRTTQNNTLKPSVEVGVDNTSKW